RKISPDGIIRAVAPIGSFGGNVPGQPVPTGDAGPATSAQLLIRFTGQGAALGDEGGLATDSSRNLYIAETAANRIRKVSPDGIIVTVAGVGGPVCPTSSNCLPLGDGGPANRASLSYPTGVAVDRNGNLFISDPGHSRIRKVSPDGTITTVAGNGSQSP